MAHLAKPAASRTTVRRSTESPTDTRQCMLSACSVGHFAPLEIDKSTPQCSCMRNAHLVCRSPGIPREDICVKDILLRVFHVQPLCLWLHMTCRFTLYFQQTNVAVCSMTRCHFYFFAFVTSVSVCPKNRVHAED